MDEVGYEAVAAGVLAVRIAALACRDVLPDEPTLTQASVVRPQVAALLALPVGPALAAGVDAVMRIPVTEAESRAAVIATAALAGYVAAAQTTVLADLTAARDERVAREVLDGQTERWGMRSGASSVGAEVAPILKVADSTAIGTVSRACYAAAHLPIALDAVAGGVMTQGQLGVLIDVTRTAPHLTGPLEAKAVTLAARLTMAQLRTELESLAARLDPDHHAEAVRRGVAERDVWLGRSPSAGCARLVADLPVEQARAMWMWITALARAAKAAGDTRRIGQLRADLLAAATTGVLRDMLEAALAAAGASGEGGSGVKVPVPTPDDLARLIELNILITDTDTDTDTDDSDSGDNDPDEPGEPNDPGGPDDSDGDGRPEDGDGGDGDGFGEDDRGGGSDGDDSGDAEGGVGEPVDPGTPDDAPDSGDGDEDDPAEQSHPRKPSELNRDRDEHLSAVRALLAALARWEAPDPGPDPGAFRRVPQPRVPVIIRWSSLTDTDDQPAHLPGDGPLPAERVRLLARGARFRWLHADPDTGYLLHRHARAHPPPQAESSWTSARSPAPPPLPEQVSAAMRSPGYVPGALLRAHVQTRDATCIGPTCHHTARGVDLDHTVNYGQRRDGRLGTTQASNLGAECRQVHLRKTHGGWRLEQPRPGHFVWTSPLGHTYERTATPLIPGWNDAA